VEVGEWEGEIEKEDDDGVRSLFFLRGEGGEATISRFLKGDRKGEREREGLEAADMPKAARGERGEGVGGRPEEDVGEEGEETIERLRRFPFPFPFPSAVGGVEEGEEISLGREGGE